ncbi:MAG: hypothetical protein ACFFBD_23235, partial [Candidatus Hodarchaeota archaeon]
MTKFYSLCIIILFVIGVLAVNGVIPTPKTEKTLINDDNEESIILNSASARYYSNGLAVPHETSESNRKKGSNSSHPLTRTVTNIVPLEELAIRPIAGPGGWILDDSVNNFAKVHDIVSVWPTTWINSGDCDGDGVDEIVLVEYFASTGVFIEACKYVDGVYQTIYQKLILNNTLFTAIDSVLGDFDGDGVDELAIGKAFGYTIEVWTWDFLENRTLGTKKIGLSFADYFSLEIEAGDLDGDGADECILAYGMFPAREMVILDDSYGSFNILKTMPYVPGEYFGIYETVVGDFDGDHIDEIALLLAGDATQTIGVKIIDDASTLYWEINLPNASLV